MNKFLHGMVRRTCGRDTIRETTSGNILRFGAGINHNDISLKLGSLMLDLGNGDAIHIDNFDPSNANNGTARWRARAATVISKAANDDAIYAWRAAA